jgi:hypothetical protein
MNTEVPKECYYRDIKTGFATADEVRIWKNFSRRIPKHLQKQRGRTRSVFLDEALIFEWAKLGYNSSEIAKDLGVAAVTLREYYSEVIAAGNAARIAEIDLELVEELTRERYTIDEVFNEITANVNKEEFLRAAAAALQAGRDSRPPTIDIVIPVTVHQPRFAPYNGTPCNHGHRARRIINSAYRCAECERLTTKSKKLQNYIGQPRKSDATYKSDTKCRCCHTHDRYVSTDKCVNCVRYYANNYSRKIGSGVQIAKRTPPQELATKKR